MKYIVQFRLDDDPRWREFASYDTEEEAAERVEQEEREDLRDGLYSWEYRIVEAGAE